MKFYETLEIDKDASKEDIKKAYKKLAIKYHPDREGGDEAKFKQISEAYEILTDDDKRRRYDQLGDSNWENSGNNGGGHPMNANDIFAQMFNNMSPFGFPGMGGMGGQGQQRQKSHHVHIMNISLKEAYNGFQKSLRVNLTKPCLNCVEQCFPCQGKGITTQIHRSGFIAQMIHAKCSECNGQGIKNVGKASCSTCKGTGSTTDNHDISLTIAPGVEHGFQERFTGLGEQKNKPDDIPGDLIFEIRITDDDDKFVRQGNDLHHEVSISLWESITGKEITIPHFDGPLKVKTKDFGTGIIQPGKKYAVSGKGMAKNGALLISFKIEYPSKRLTTDERKVIQELFETLNLV